MSFMKQENNLSFPPKYPKQTAKETVLEKKISFKIFIFEIILLKIIST